MLHHTSIQNVLIRFGHQMASIWFKHIFSCMTLFLSLNVSSVLFFTFSSYEHWEREKQKLKAKEGENPKCPKRSNINYVRERRGLRIWVCVFETYADLYVAYQTLWSVPHWLFTDTKLFIQPECSHGERDRMSLDSILILSKKPVLENKGFHFFSGHRRRNKNWNGKPHLVKHEFIIIETHACTHFNGPPETINAVSLI